MRQGSCLSRYLHTISRKLKAGREGTLNVHTEHDITERPTTTKLVGRTKEQALPMYLTLL